MVWLSYEAVGQSQKQYDRRVRSNEEEQFRHFQCDSGAQPDDNLDYSNRHLGQVSERSDLKSTYRSPI